MSAPLVEGIAEVVAVEGNTLWLEAERLTACGGCVSASSCGIQGQSPGRLASGRFPLVNDFGGRLGDRVVVGISEGSLVRASTTAYVLPLLGMLGGAVGGHLLTGGEDAAAGGAVLGLLAGLLLAVWRAKRLTARGELTPRYLRPASGPAESCHPGETTD